MTASQGEAVSAIPARKLNIEKESTLKEAKPRKQRTTVSTRVDVLKPANIVINVRFNGLTHFCNLTGYSTSTAHGWLTGGFIPAQRKGQSVHTHILGVAKEASIAMEATDFVERPAEQARELVEANG